MNRWSARRKTIIFLIVLLILFVILGVPAYFLSRNTPDCFNGIRDGDETGVDCGGSCALICTPEILPLISRGDIRLLKVATSTYETAVLIENPNTDGQVRRAAYLISIYSGSSRTPVRVFERETFVGRSSTFALFEGPFVLEGEGPFRAVFEWSPALVWEKSEDPTPLLVAESTNLILNASPGPRLEARLTNRSPRDEQNIEVVALLSDASGNIVSAGKTFVDSLKTGASVPIIFSWPTAFMTEPVSIRILPHPLPDKSFLR